MLDIVQQLKGSVETLQQRTSDLSLTSADIAGRVQTVQSQLELVAKPATVPKDEDVWSAESIKRVLEISSLWGLCAVTLVVDAWAAPNKRLNLTKYSTNGGPTGLLYLQGYLVALDAVDIFDTKVQSSESDVVYVVNTVQPQLAEVLRAEWSRRLAGAKPDAKERWQKFIDATQGCVS